MNDKRPDPDALLSAVKRDEARRQRGKLKIFLGMAAGVGKTYAMLEAGRRLKDEGVDVIVGYVETHGRTETEALLRGLEVALAPEVGSDREAVFEEMDTDALWLGFPNLGSVDELAHTNIPGVRYVKRFQDIIEILEVGIDVQTTVNVQHFDKLLPMPSGGLLGSPYMRRCRIHSWIWPMRLNWLIYHPRICVSG